MTHDDANRALEWLLQNAEPAAEARAERLQLEDFSKALLASLEIQTQQEQPKLAANALQRLALAHADYSAHLLGLKEARRKDERMRWLRDTAHAKIEVFRTLESTKRALKL